MAKDPKTDPKNFYPRYATNNCADCNDFYYTKWGRVRQTNYDLFLPENTIIAACRNEKGFYPFRDERGLGMSELREPHYSTLAASGALSLGTTAGTDRSISAEFGGSTPHGLSEYYDVASGIPASGAIDFSDFHGKAAANPTVTSCLWTHYDFSSCSVGSLVAACTTSAAAEQQCLRVGYMDTLTWNDTTCAQICTLTSNSISNNYWLACSCMSFKTCAGNAFWGTGNSSQVGVDNTVFLVWKSIGFAAAETHHWIRWNSGYNGYTMTSYGYYRVFSSGHAWRIYKLASLTCLDSLYVYGSDSENFGAIVTFATDSGTIDPTNDSMIMGHRVFSGMVNDADCSNFQLNYINASQVQTFPSWCNYSATANRMHSRVTAENAGGFDYFNGMCSQFDYDEYNYGAAACFAIGEYLHYKCKLTDAEWNATFTYLKDKWSVSGGKGSC